MMLPLIEEKLKLLPDLPGSYQMRDTSGTVIYVGKAKNLKTEFEVIFTEHTMPKQPGWSVKSPILLT